MELREINTYDYVCMLVISEMLAHEFRLFWEYRDPFQIQKREKAGT